METQPVLATQERRPGPLLLIGGAEDTIGGRLLLRRFVALAGGSNAVIAVLTTASSYPDYVGRRYTAVFRDLGARDVTVLDAQTRPACSRPELLTQLAASSGVFISGGDQLKLVSVLGGTPLAAHVRARHADGAVIGGTSAGASAVCEHMLAYGESGIPPRKAMMQFAPGLGLISGVVVDQHFGARSRAGRLLTAVAHNPRILGVGLDEDTAVEIDEGGLMTVLGRGSVMVVDGSDLTYTDIHRVPQHAPLTIFNVKMHVMTSGYHYDIPTRTPIIPVELPPTIPDRQGTEGEGI
jgi:cyanophycinase